MDRSKVIALDPGKTTGFASKLNDEINTYQLDFDGRMPHLSLFTHLTEFKPTVLVFESFRFRQGQTGVVYDGVEMIGVAKLWCQINDVPIFPISSSEGKAFWNNEKLKALGFYKPNLVHGMDAVRVLFTWLTKNDDEWYKASIQKLRSSLRIV